MAENLLAARLEPPPDEVYALRSAVRHNSAATRGAMLVRNRMRDAAGSRMRLRPARRSSRPNSRGHDGRNAKGSERLPLLV